MLHTKLQQLASFLTNYQGKCERQNVLSMQKDSLTLGCTDFWEQVFLFYGLANLGYVADIFFIF